MNNVKWRTANILIIVTDGIMAVRLLESVRKARFDWLTITMCTRDEVYEIAALWSGQGEPQEVPGLTFLKNLELAEIFAKAFKLGYEAGRSED